MPEKVYPYDVSSYYRISQIQFVKPSYIAYVVFSHKDTNTDLCCIEVDFKSKVNDNWTLKTRLERYNSNFHITHTALDKLKERAEYFAKRAVNALSDDYGIVTKV